MNFPFAVELKSRKMNAQAEFEVFPEFPSAESECVAVVVNVRR